MRFVIILLALSHLIAVDERPMSVGPMTDPSSESPSDSVRAAMAARLILDAAVSGSPARWIFHHETTAPVQLSDAEFLEALVAIPKPVYCRSHAVDSMTAVVSCESPSPSQQAHIALRSRELERGEGFFEDFAPMLAWRGRLKVRLRSQRSTLTLSFDEWKCFVESFDIGGASMLGVRLPEPTEGLETGVIVVQAGRVEEYRGPIPPI